MKIGGGNISFDNLTVVIAVIILPGLIAASLFDKFTTGDPNKKEFRYYFVKSLMFGYFSYVVLDLIMKIFHSIGWLTPYQTNLFSSISSGDLNIQLWEVTFSTIIALVGSILIIGFVNKRTFNSFLKKIGKDHYFESTYTLDDAFRNKKAGWVIVRDYKNGYAYKGYIEYYSVDSPSIELLMKKVKVLNIKTNEKISTIPWIFLQFEVGSLIIIEFLTEIE